ncbi:MAG: hypothetical protein J6S67_10780 [Methanobrevibacter sp.]|nr:hypothetical protein [Methanobrevibacter sp.]
MEILILILLILLLFLNAFVLYTVFLKQKKPVKTEAKPKLTKEEKDKQKEIKKAFDNLMNYDENAARKRRK